MSISRLSAKRERNAFFAIKTQPLCYITERKNRNQLSVGTQFKTERSKQTNHIHGINEMQIMAHVIQSGANELQRAARS
jgi:hypothetical protein